MPHPRRIAFINEKGGSAKTTLVANIGSYLALYRGHKVLAIDKDDPDAIMAKGRLLLRAKKPMEAAKVFQALAREGLVSSFRGARWASFFRSRRPAVFRRRTRSQAIWWSSEPREKTTPVIDPSSST